MIKILDIDHLVLRTAHLEAMLAFYHDVLGCRIERDEVARIGLMQLRAGNALIDLVVVDSELGRLGGGAPSQDGNNLDHFCLRIQAISNEELKSYLISQGVECEDFATRNGAQGFGDSVYIQDPDGNKVELKSALGTSSQNR